MPMPNAVRWHANNHHHLSVLLTNCSSWPESPKLSIAGAGGIRDNRHGFWLSLAPDDQWDEVHCVMHILGSQAALFEY